MRINKFISHYTKYSRREAEKLILNGKVKVNNKIVKEFIDIKNGDKVKINNKLINPKKSITTVIIYNKPKGELVTKKDTLDRKTIYHSLGGKFRSFIPVGRLDFASCGLLLLTNKVDIATTLMESNVPRLYKIKIKGNVTKEIIEAMENGLSLEDATKGAYKDTKTISMDFKPFKSYEILKNGTYSKLKIVLTEGKNREIRRFFGYFNREVLDLKRLEFGPFKLNNLPEGKSRFLTSKEYKILYELVKELREK